MHQYNYNKMYVRIYLSGYIFHLSILHIPKSIQYYLIAFQYNLEGSTIYTYEAKCVHYYIIYTSLLLASLCIHLCNISIQ